MKKFFSLLILSPIIVLPCFAANFGSSSLKEIPSISYEKSITNDKTPNINKILEKQGVHNYIMPTKQIYNIDGVDFTPYMSELQRRIRLYWEPQKGFEKKKIVLLFKITKNGGLQNLRIYKSSGNRDADRAAINAVKDAAPFRPLPKWLQKDSADIQFTFD